jgi:hypothetical protein
MSFARLPAVAAAAMLLTTPAGAQSGWNRIGQAAATAEASSATITPRASEVRRELMFCVEGGAVRINGAVVRFQGGRTQSLQVRARIADGACGRPISLSARNQPIEAVEFSYDPAILAGTGARVQIYGR